jgi:hypothetical protein
MLALTICLWKILPLAGVATVPGDGLSPLTPLFGPNGFYQQSPNPYGGPPGFGAYSDQGADYDTGNDAQLGSLPFRLDD